MAMEAVKRAASGAVETIRNSPLFKRRGSGGRYQKTDSELSASMEEEGVSARDRADGGEDAMISPEEDRSPFVQGVYYHADYLGRQEVDASRAQDHGCTDQSVALLWQSPSPARRKGSSNGGGSFMGGGEGGKANGNGVASLLEAAGVNCCVAVSVKVTTSNVRIKELSSGKVLYEYPLFRVSYCGTDMQRKEGFSFVVKESDGHFYCHVFRCSSREKAYHLALALAKAFYLASQIVQEEHGEFPPTPERERLFEPQTNRDTQSHPPRPTIPPSPPTPHPIMLDVKTPTDTEDEVDAQEVRVQMVSMATKALTPPPRLRVSRPSQTSAGSVSVDAESAMDDDFMRLAKARSNPNILRSTLTPGDVTGDWLDLSHADPSSSHHTPRASCEHLA